MKKAVVGIVVLLAVAGACVGGYFGYQALVTPPEKLRDAFYWALRDGDTAKVRAMLSDNRRLAVTPYKGDDPPPLCEACGTFPPIKNQTEIARLLLDNGADPDACYGSPLFGAIYCDNTELIKLLLERGADPHIKPPAKGNEEARSPYEDAKWRGREYIIQVFEDHMAGKKK